MEIGKSDLPDVPDGAADEPAADGAPELDRPDPRVARDLVTAKVTSSSEEELDKLDCIVT